MFRMYGSKAPLGPPPREKCNYCPSCAVGGKPGLDAVCWLCEQPYAEKLDFTFSSSPDIFERTTT